ncbi:MAG: YkgJ family cysteine cluster protein [Desulfohalobiaceae bacterium]
MSGLQSRQECSRCGTCCMSNPPGLHPQDQALYSAGVLQKEHLLTLRTGELVWDNIQQRILPLEQEMVRLQARPGSTACIFYQPLRRSCSIHGRHPLECRAQKCWDTRQVYQAYQQPRLDRLDLLPADSALGRIIQEHEKICPYPRVKELAEQILSAGLQAAEQELTGILQADLNMRGYLEQHADASRQELLFLFGRRLLDTLPGLGLEARQQAVGFEFRPCKLEGSKF